jgi:hypothetical protein
MLPASIAPSALPAPTMVCSSSITNDVAAVSPVRSDGFQTLLELAAKLGACDQSAHVQRGPRSSDLQALRR